MTGKERRSFSLKGRIDVAVIRHEHLYLVGGTVRDLLLNKVPKDLDLVCRHAKKTASQIAVCRNAALVPMEKKPDEPCYRVVDRDAPGNFIDIAEMRGESIREDLMQRDFTVNALAMEIKKDGSPGQVIDPMNGAYDIEQKIIRIVSEKAFEADPLRMVRAVRLAAELDFDIEGQTVRKMQEKPRLLTGVSPERITTELLLILKSPKSTSFFRQMDTLGILEVLFPEVVPMKQCQQNGCHHKDVWEHSLLTMEHTEEITGNLRNYFGGCYEGCDDILTAGRIQLLKLTALLHDVGKPSTTGINPATGRITFYGHDKEGAAIADAIAGRMRMSNEAREFISKIVAEHLHPLMLASPKAKAAATMRWFRRMRDDAVPALILSMADVMSSLGPDSGETYRRNFITWAGERGCEYLKSLKAKIESSPLINGDDLIALALEPGPVFGKILARIRDAQNAGEISSREEALEAARQMISREDI